MTESKLQEFEVAKLAPDNADEFKVGKMVKLIGSDLVIHSVDFPKMTIKVDKRMKRFRLNRSIVGLVETINGEMFYVKCVAGRRIYLLNVKEVQ